MLKWLRKNRIFQNLKSLTSQFLEKARYSEILVPENCLSFLDFLGFIFWHFWLLLEFDPFWNIYNSYLGWARDNFVNPWSADWTKVFDRQVQIRMRELENEIPRSVRRQKFTWETSYQPETNNNKIKRWYWSDWNWKGNVENKIWWTCQE